MTTEPSIGDYIRRAQEARVKSLRSCVADLEKEIGRLRAELAAKDAEIAQLKEQVKSRDHWSFNAD